MSFNYLCIAIHSNIESPRNVVADNIFQAIVNAITLSFEFPFVMKNLEEPNSPDGIAWLITIIGSEKTYKIYRTT